MNFFCTALNKYSSSKIEFKLENLNTHILVQSIIQNTYDRKFTTNNVIRLCKRVGFVGCLFIITQIRRTLDVRFSKLGLSFNLNIVCGEMYGFVCFCNMFLCAFNWLIGYLLVY